LEEYLKPFDGFGKLTAGRAQGRQEEIFAKMSLSSPSILPPRGVAGILATVFPGTKCPQHFLLGVSVSLAVLGGW
jgi:hypothetical protein